MPAVQFKRTIQSPCSFYKGLSFIGLRIIRYNLVEDDKIVYLDGELMVRNIFDKNIFYKDLCCKGRFG